jgi:glutathione synthase/RimK-type ligase-like ATP-grasp enzyme
MLVIYDRKGSFSDRWIKVCSERGTPFQTIDIFADGLFETLRAIKPSAVLAHPPMADPRGQLASKSIVHSMELAGYLTFPSYADFWHFDDKIAQKYIFDALSVRHPKTHVFLEKEAAHNWAREATFPLVFKLKAGAGSSNVRLIQSKEDAYRVIDRMFSKGYPATDSAIKDLKTKIRKHRLSRDWLATISRAPKTLSKWFRLRGELPWERGYSYFQEYLPANDFDTRVTVIGDKAFAFRRFVRPGDFRASGSGLIDYARENVDLACIKAAFQIAGKLGSTCVAFDFIKAKHDREPVLVEISFAFVPTPVFNCPGHWTKDLVWHEGNLWPQDTILDLILTKISQCSSHQQSLTQRSGDPYKHK